MGNDLGGEQGVVSEGLQLAYLFLWPAQFGCSQVMSAFVGGWDTGMSLGKNSWRSLQLVRGPRGKRDHSSCSAKELKVRLGRLRLWQEKFEDIPSGDLWKNLY